MPYLGGALFKVSIILDGFFLGGDLNCARVRVPFWGSYLGGVLLQGNDLGLFCLDAVLYLGSFFFQGWGL